MREDPTRGVPIGEVWCGPRLAPGERDRLGGIRAWAHRIPASVVLDRTDRRIALINLGSNVIATGTAAGPQLDPVGECAIGLLGGDLDDVRETIALYLDTAGRTRFPDASGRVLGAVWGGKTNVTVALDADRELVELWSLGVPFGPARVRRDTERKRVWIDLREDTVAALTRVGLSIEDVSVNVACLLRDHARLLDAAEREPEIAGALSEAARGKAGEA